MRISRKWIVPLIFAGALALLAAPAQASITGTAHEVGTGMYQSCSVCHIPHGGAAARLWPISPPTTLGGVVANLCGTCHNSAGAYAVTFSAASNANVYAAQSHGNANYMTVADAPAGSTVASSGLPYVANASIECTSCHNVHADPSDTDATDAGEFRPFLRDSLENLCLRCHQSRTTFATQDAFGAWSAAIRSTNPGLHPLGTNITGDVTNVGNSPISWSVLVDATQSATARAWSLGGHRSSGGAMSCATCHAVHGRNWDTTHGGAAPAGWTDNSPGVDMLAVNQATGWNSNVADGDASFNYLCEACHAGNETAYASANYNWNPGGTAYGHPVDDMGAIATGNFSGSFGTNWPVGGAVGTFISGTNATSPVPICESCHSPHVQINFGGSGRTDLSEASATLNPFILRATTNLCAGCHNGTATIGQHHPVGTARDGSDAVPEANLGYLNLAASTVLGCGTCHEAGGMDNSVHNWGQAGRPNNVAMRAGWRPADNGRSDATYPIFGSGAAGDYYPSTTCMDCHLNLAGRADYNVSTRAAVDNEYQIHGNGSHFVGNSPRSWFGAKTLPTGGASFTVTTQNWSVGTSGTYVGAAARSVFGEGDGSTTYSLVCESCHNVDPDKNVAGTKLLLGTYVEGGQDTNADYCESCHGTPAGTHPMTGDSVGTGGAHTLVTSGSNFIAPAAGSGPTYDADGISCDSCHQPHSAATAGVALIIDTASANITGGADNTVTLTGVNAGNPVSNRKTKAAGNLPQFNAFCSQCHPF